LISKSWDVDRRAIFARSATRLEEGAKFDEEVYVVEQNRVGGKDNEYLKDKHRDRTKKF
jgi:hypothetical protein